MRLVKSTSPSLSLDLLVITDKGRFWEGVGLVFQSTGYQTRGVGLSVRGFDSNEHGVLCTQESGRYEHRHTQSQEFE